jgi:hypothetical protein
MRLSRALCVVLLLHLIALAGVYAFTYVKDHKVVTRASREATAASGATIRTPTPRSKGNEAVAEEVARRDSLKNIALRPREVVGAKKSPQQTESSQVVLPKAKKKASVAATSSGKMRTGQDAAMDLIGAQSN